MTTTQPVPAEYLEDHPGLSLAWDDSDIEAAFHAGLTHEAIWEDVGMFPLVGDDAKSYIAAVLVRR